MKRRPCPICGDPDNHVRIIHTPRVASEKEETMSGYTPGIVRQKGEWLRTQWGFENYGTEYIAIADAWEADKAHIEALETRLARHECVECGRETNHEADCSAALAAKTAKKDYPRPDEDGASFAWNAKR